MSRWEIRLPYEGLPTSSLVCRTDAPLFDRPVTLFEEVRENHGRKRVVSLGKGQWVRTAKTDSLLELPIKVRPQTGRWVLEIENGDNAPIALRDFAVYHPAVHLLFKTGDTASLDFYYGNRKAVPPSYDLALVAAQLMRANRAVATLGNEEALETAGTGPRPIGGKPGVVFWAVLIVVVLGLLVLISRLLPGAPEP
ncbi:MAG: hypothetical protein GWO24_02470 [Akkermansiaceae bacterium]|nr:hypothetical protein [Akkermansiaceae bacterium]